LILSVRIYELAREFDMSNKEVVDICREAGLSVKSHSSTIEEYEAEMVRRRLTNRLAGEPDDAEPEAPAAAAPAAAPPPPTPAVPLVSPEEQLARARQMRVMLPTRAAVKPGLLRRPPPTHPSSAPGAATPSETQGPSAEAAAPVAPTAAEASPAAPVAEAQPGAAATLPAAAAPSVAAAAPPAPVAVVPPVAPTAAAPSTAAPAAVAPAAPVASTASAPAAPTSAPSAPAVVAPAAPTSAAAPPAAAAPGAPAATEETRERFRPMRRPPGPKLAPKPMRPGPKLAPRPKPHPQAVKETVAPPAPHPQAVGVTTTSKNKKKDSPVRPSRPKGRPKPGTVEPGAPPPPTAAEAAAAAERRGRRKGGAAKKPGEEEAEGLRRAAAFRRRERIRKRDDDDVTPGSEGGAGSLVAKERVRLSRTGRPMGSRASRPVVRAATAEGPKKAVVELPTSIKTLSAAIGVKASAIIQLLMGKGVMATINDLVTEEQVLEIALAKEIEIEIRHERAPADAIQEIEVRKDPPELLVLRPPVVTFLGHVDHGKTSLMDYIRKSHVAAGEAGGITQHIGAYRVYTGERWITFLDTPGHAAFTAMRARGARVTDVAVLVVAADDGVMPQTEEAINHAKAAEVPIVVAINKSDLPQANPLRVKQQLTQYGLLSEEWGGQTICIETSAVTGAGVDKLLESLFLEAEMRELRANPERPALGTVIEASLSEGLGPQATLLVQNGTLRPGDVVVAGTAYGKIRALKDETGKRLTEAPPSAPVRVSGLSDVPEAGDRFYVLDNISLAKQLAEEHQLLLRQRALIEQRKPRTLEAVFEQMATTEAKELPLIIKADVQGSVEALQDNLEKIEHPEVRVHVIHAGVGGINDSDVLLADASSAIIIGFNAVPDQAARMLAEERGVDIRLYSIIYDATDDVRKALEGMLAPKQEEHHLGEGNVIDTFKISRVGTIAGVMMTDGVITRNSRIRIIRDGVVVHTGSIQSLKRVKEDVREVRSGQDCGIHVASYDDIKVGDRIEAFETISVARKL
jgi:translation initiation factor IF-2